ncbi:uncharacterized protein BKA78DRAFT_126349 [Phyllosticta capitalensis]|uniref:uncharacterized protein n=1 Tax=Phyllosticta capitalensis TaxID=121624 RepID=UPI003132079A
MIPRYLFSYLLLVSTLPFFAFLFATTVCTSMARVSCFTICHGLAFLSLSSLDSAVCQQAPPLLYSTLLLFGFPDAARLDFLKRQHYSLALFIHIFLALMCLCFPPLLGWPAAAAAAAAADGSDRLGYLIVLCLKSLLHLSIPPLLAFR